MGIATEHHYEGENEGSAQCNGGSTIYCRVISHEREEGRPRLYNNYFLLTLQLVLIHNFVRDFSYVDHYFKNSRIDFTSAVVEVLRLPPL